MDFFLLVLCLLFAIALLRKTRALGVRAEEDSIRHSVERVKAQWVNVDMNEDETTPPSEPLADETYTPREPTIWDIEIEKYFSKESE
jgi:hypothetical protein